MNKNGEAGVERLDLSLDDLIGLERKAARATGLGKDPRPVANKIGVGQMGLGVLTKPTKKKGQPRNFQGIRRQRGQELFRGNANQMFRLQQANAAADAALMPPRGGQHPQVMAQRPRRNQGQRARVHNPGMQQPMYPAAFRTDYGRGGTYSQVPQQGGRPRQQQTARGSGYNHRMDSSHQDFGSNHGGLGVGSGGIRKVSSRQMRLSSTVHKPQTLSDRFNAYRTTSDKRSPGSNMGGGAGFSRGRMNGAGGGMGYGGNFMQQRQPRRGLGQYKTGVSGGRSGFGQQRRDNLRVVLNN
ncbi:hypothetical protein BSKO_01255 [Bryopsis sp. KO-2023]|nr:hypothetical protein BSKO_01255 [Bryopsis sp. KO-2023]